LSTENGFYAKILLPGGEIITELVEESWYFPYR
jgi:hypothetical protein